MVASVRRQCHFSFSMSIAGICVLERAVLSESRSSLSIIQPQKSGVAPRS